AGNVALVGGADTSAYAQIGHGGALSNFGTTVAFSDTGDISLSGAIVSLAAGSGTGAYAQVGHGGYDAGAEATLSSGSIVISGSINLAATGNLVMSGNSGTGAYAQIGNGGANTSGSESGAISVIAAGNVALVGGADTSAYAQIGHGGALSNFGTTVAFSDTGNITLSGAIVSLAAGTGTGAYAQVGHGGYDAGADAAISSGSILISGSINLTATGNLVMSGSSGTGAYAQIGNGGFGADTHATVLAGGTISETGDIVIATGTSGSAGTIVITGDAYSQIGNGGYDENSGASASGISEGGDISLSLNGGTGTINAGNEGNFAYGQVGNGDAAHTSTGDVSGNIDVSSSGPWTLNGSPSAPAWMWNATGSGSVAGSTSIDGSPFLPPGTEPPPPPPPPSTTSGPSSSDVNSILSTTTLPSDLGSPPPGTGSGDTTSLAGSLNAIAPTAGPGAIELLTDSSGGGATGEAPAGAGQEADQLSSALALSLTKVSAPATQASSCVRSNSGATILCQIAPEPGAGQTPVGVQSADQTYSSWGNESLWQD
ncbi:MAG TPA: hypothetical protein VLV50_08055, partial [Stellaceae bacterium]|nr:hypothetical protein [Stellaceae bacterium]